MKICPFDGKNVEKSFSEFWTGVFTDAWITIDEIAGSYVGIRTIIEYDLKKNDYVVVKKPIIEWNESIETSKIGKKQSYTSDMYDFINNYYMDAKRDIITDVRDKKSYFGRATSKIDLTDDKVEELEAKLNSVNQEMIDNTFI